MNSLAWRSSCVAVIEAMSAALSSKRALPNLRYWNVGFASDSTTILSMLVALPFVSFQMRVVLISLCIWSLMQPTYSNILLCAKRRMNSLAKEIALPARTTSPTTIAMTPISREGMDAPPSPSTSILFVAESDAVQDFVAEGHGSIAIHERAAHFQNEHVTNVFAGFRVASQDGESVQTAGVDFAAAILGGVAEFRRALVPMESDRDAVEHADSWMRPPTVGCLRRAVVRDPWQGRKADQSQEWSSTICE
jgi:hypothetical protein